RAASGTSTFWKFLNASVTGANASLTVSNTVLVSVVVGFSPSSGSSYGLTPSGFGPGQGGCGIVNVGAQHECCIAISRTRDMGGFWAVCPPCGLSAGPPPAGQTLPIERGTARYCARGRRYRGFCPRDPGHGRGAAPRP